MKFELFGYQVDAAADIISALNEGYDRFNKNGKLTAVSLAAPTGAGKTVIATTVIEQLFYGSDGAAPRTGTTVLWVTDDPSLNEQTKSKMLQASSLIQPGQLVTVDASLDQKTLSRGKVYFINIQKLGKTTSFVTTGDKRQHSLWDIIGNTIEARGDDFVLIIDEAHKGTATKNGGKSITAQLMDGTEGTLPPPPVVIGISATPKRFVDAITSGQRTLQPVSVDNEAVRLSGLIKDKISIRHPKESQPGDSTLLSLAIKSLKNYDERWAKYAEEQNEPVVSPVLVIQIKAKATDTELREVLDTLASQWSILDDKAIGHSFQDHSTLNLGSRSVRYVAPQSIQDDPALRVVLFKEALSTGWDCPRAEVMFSFRTAQDYTYIAQLIGRMVRTPLARRISTDGVLNTVALYLPHYDDDQVAQVVKSLESDEGGFTPSIEIDSVACPRNPEVPPAVWDCFANIATFTRPARHSRNDVTRLNALATLLVGNGIDREAMDTAHTHITNTLKTEATRLGAALDAAAADLEQLTYQIQTVDLISHQVEKETAQTSVNSRNIEDLFRQAQRTLGDSAAKWYCDSLCEDGIDDDAAKIRVAALAQDPSVAIALEAAAKTLVATWREQHNGAISSLSDAKLERFYNIWQQSKSPEKVALILPTQITAATKIVKSKEGQEVVTVVPRYKKHVFSNGKSTFPSSLNTWETEVLAAELAKKTLVAWYRNPTGGIAALAVPYEESRVAKTMYPDFVFFHEVKGELFIDIVDPHDPTRADAGPKWTGLAKYAKDHGAVLRRVVAVIVRNSDKKLISLDLKNPNAADRLSKATNSTDILSIFKDFGGSY